MGKFEQWCFVILVLVFSILTIVVTSEGFDQANTKLGDCVTLNDTEYARILMCKKEK